MSATALADLTRAIQGRLARALGPGAVFLGSPAEDAARAAQVSLFLLRVSPNGDLRNTARRLPPADPAAPPRMRERALPLDAYFLLTAGAGEFAREPTGLGALGRAIQVMEDEPLFGLPELEDQAVRCSIEPAGEDVLSRMWSLFPTSAYRTSVVYLATPVWIDPAIERREPPRVLDAAFDYASGTGSLRP